MRIRSLRTTCLTLLILLLTATISGPSALAREPLFVLRNGLSLKPGQSAKLIIPISNAPDAPIAWLELVARHTNLHETASNSAGIESAGSRSCAGQVTAYGPGGVTLWIWKSTQTYDLVGPSPSNVSLKDNYVEATTYLLWIYDHGSYTTKDNFTQHARATSTGYFRSNIQRSTGIIQFEVYNTRCDVYGGTGTW